MTPPTAHPCPVALAREHIGAVTAPEPGESPEVDRLRCIAAGVVFERARIVAWLRAEAEERRLSGAPPVEVRIHSALADDLSTR